MEMWCSKCDTCGLMAYIFPDQLQLIKNNPKLALHVFAKGKLKIGSKWFCIRCDASKKNPLDCKIIAELTGEEAAKKIKIRTRETNMKSMGFELPSKFQV